MSKNTETNKRACDLQRQHIAKNKQTIVHFLSHGFPSAAFLQV